jgi:D-3-phosphoglycerate dehydrogenase
MYKAVIVDRDYGSISIDKQHLIKEEYNKNGIKLALNHFKTPEEIIENCKDVDIILGTGNPPITREVIESLPNLKIIQRFGVGVNSIDLEAATEHGVLVLFMPGFCASELAYHSIALAMSILRNVVFYDREIRNGEWPKAKGPVPRDPKNLVLGLYGFGDSAKPLYNIFKHGFGSRVIANDKYINPETLTDYDIELVEFEDLLRESDIISIHAPLTNETRHIFNKNTFKLMKNDSIIINVARGPIINEEDLIEALENNEIGFAGLDVFESEPLEENSKLLTMDNVVLTAHSAFYGDGAQKNQIQWSIDLVDQAINHKKINNKFIANKDVTSKIEGLRRS